MATFAERLKSLRREKGWSQQRLADELDLSKSSVNMYERGEREPGFETMEAIADLFNVDMNYLYGRTDIKIADPIVLAPKKPTIPPGFEPMPKMKKIPLIGSIACGEPITAEQNIERYIGVPAAWRADFALTCHGDSMSPTICDGDIVCIRCQPEVEQGEIAAVRIGGEATLKHFHRQGDAVMLLADNAAVCPPMIFTGLQLEELHIEGRAVGLCRGL
mgnify:CR=1 FL=1